MLIHYLWSLLGNYGSKMKKMSTLISSNMCILSITRKCQPLTCLHKWFHRVHANSNFHESSRNPFTAEFIVLCVKVWFYTIFFLLFYLQKTSLWFQFSSILSFLLNNTSTHLPTKLCVISHGTVSHSKCWMLIYPEKIHKWLGRFGFLVLRKSWLQLPTGLF